MRSDNSIVARTPKLDNLDSGPAHPKLGENLACRFVFNVRHSEDRIVSRRFTQFNDVNSVVLKQVHLLKGTLLRYSSIFGIAVVDDTISLDSTQTISNCPRKDLECNSKSVFKLLDWQQLATVQNSRPNSNHLKYCELRGFETSSSFALAWW